MARFDFETELVATFTHFMRTNSTPFKPGPTALEFDYRSGRTDVISRTETHELVAFEAKLRNWKVALHQAYRNSHFAHFSYVVLPSEYASAALKNVKEFKRRGVGLCVVHEAGVQVAIEATHKPPLQPWLTKAALNAIAA